MNRRAFIFGTTAFVSGSIILGATSAFSTSETERDVTIDVVGDEDAFMQLVYSDIDLQDEEEPPYNSVTLVTLGNQFQTPIEVVAFDIETTSDNVSITDLSIPNTLGVGEQHAVTGTIHCDDSGTGETTVRFDTAVRGDATYAETTESREFDLALACPPDD